MGYVVPLIRYVLAYLLYIILQIKNTHFFQTTEGVEFSWYASADGCNLGYGILSLAPIKPQSSYTIDWQSGPWYSLWALSLSEEVFLTITAKLLNSTRWVEAGHIVSYTQIQLPAKRDFIPHVIILTHDICYKWSLPLFLYE